MQSTSPEYFVVHSALVIESDLSLRARYILPIIANLSRLQRCTLTNKRMEKLLSCSDRKVSEVLKELIDAKLITSNGSRNNRELSVTDAGWALLKWGGGSVGEVAAASAPLPNPPANDAKPEAKAAAEPKPKKGRAKKSLTIEEHCARNLPRGVDPAAWRAFVEMKHAEHGPFSERAANGIVNKLEAMKADGHDPNKLLKLATDSCWQSVYSDKTTKAGGAPPPPANDQRIGPNGARYVEGIGWVRTGKRS